MLPPAEDVTTLDNLPLILPTRSNSRRILVEKAFAEAGLRLNVAYQADGYSVIRSLLNAGLGYTILTHSAVSGEIALGSLSAAKLTRPRMSWTLSLAIPKEQRHNRVVQSIARIVREETTRLVNNGDWYGELCGA